MAIFAQNIRCDIIYKTMYNKIILDRIIKETVRNALEETFQLNEMAVERGIESIYDF